ncbi:NAD-dependent epimerase/dehydratase family protein [Umezawaea endophytica]|uniref:NAD(P)-dependent oxidoreductase n=1 Tax=Umezawaea endophytica TaxID=1654476 RepID=A0A9X2VJC7_9PSEU|nr:NAD(P)-dependent oxidoreductase [Umezawaea endophytica]MCS7477700.1 NAD(P)-dependent oxidoreductase [Umezawaea endophytica]
MGEEELDEELGRPSPALVGEAAGWAGDVVVLGAGGKTGSGIAGMARRALDEAGRADVRVRAVSRWSDPDSRDRVAARGVEVVAADLADPAAVAGLPDAEVVVFLVGAKFGTADAPEQAWMTNAVLPAYIAERYPRARIVALSTGNVYGMTEPVGGGSVETDEPRPEGNYAITCLGREQVFTHAARTRGTPVALVRLNYACEPRYGVIADLARRVLDGEPVDLGTGAVNVVWQRYANEVVLRCVARASDAPFVLNLTGPETASVRSIATRLADRLGAEAAFTGSLPGTSLLSDASLCHGLFGYPDRTLDGLIDLQVEWLRAGGHLWDKPTKFERRDGRF